jgi:hypothetical protein
LSNAIVSPTLSIVSSTFTAGAAEALVLGCGTEGVDAGATDAVVTALEADVPFDVGVDLLQPELARVAMLTAKSITDVRMFISLAVKFEVDRHVCAFDGGGLRGDG